MTETFASAPTIDPIGPVPIPSGVKHVTYPICVPAPLHTRLRREPAGQGGWQTLLADLRMHTDPVAPVADIPDALLRRMIPYAVKFGGGGYQSVIRHVLCLILEQHMDRVIGQAAGLGDLVGGKTQKPNGGKVKTIAKTGGTE